LISDPTQVQCDAAAVGQDGLCTHAELADNVVHLTPVQTAFCLSLLSQVNVTKLDVFYIAPNVTATPTPTPTATIAGTPTPTPDLNQRSGAAAATYMSMLFLVVAIALLMWN
jgi:hypothetical protein